MARNDGAAALAGQIDWRRCLRLGAVGAAVACGLVVLSMLVSPSPDPGSTAGGYTRTYTPPHDRFEVLLNHADGQAYATLAQDPTLSRPDAFTEGPGGVPTFAGRPVLPYLLWTLSLGRPGLLSVAFVVVETVAGGLLVLGAAALMHATGRSRLDRLAFVTLALPGAVMGVAWLGPDALAVGVVLVALVLWAGERPRPWLAAALFLVAGLTRETMLVVPLVLLVWGLANRGWRRTDLLLVGPFAAFLAWGAFVSARVGEAGGQGIRRNADLPFVGIGRSIGGWDAIGIVVVSLQVLLVAWSLVQPVCRLVWWIVATYAVVMTMTSVRVWDEWQAGARVTLPLVVFALLDLRLPAPVQRLVDRRPRGAPAVPS